MELRPQGKQNKTMCLYRCAGCGKDLWIDPSKLPTHGGFCRSCCSRDGIQAILPRKRGLRKRPFEWLLNRLRHISSKRGLTVMLTYEEFLEFTQIAECHYCGSTILWTDHNQGRGNARTNLDRKNNALGYSKENCVVACIVCNRIKNNYLSYEDMMELSPVLRRILPQKNWVETHRKQVGA
jgi:5-methylcytosine-specific restriction endonuclease McrA